MNRRKGAGATPIVELLETDHRLIVPGSDTGENRPRGLPLVGLDEILAYQPDPNEEIWRGGILCKRSPAGIIGAPGAGKSRIVLQGAIATILGKPFLGWETNGQGLKWMFLQTENSMRRLKNDLLAMTSKLTEDERQAIRESLRILDVGKMDFATICMTDGHPDKFRILEALEDFNADIVVADPLRDTGNGDLNKDMDMMAACQGISATLYKSNPRRTPFTIHHGRTGAVEASKVFGDDAGSFARNSKVLNGWLRSQINIAPAGIEFPDTIIVGCGKNSDDRKWDPFAATLDSETMTYRRLLDLEFDLGQWAEKMSGMKRVNRLIPTPEEVAEVVQKAGGEVRGGVRDDNGLVLRLKRAARVTRESAIIAVEAAVGVTITEGKEPGKGNRGGGKPGVIYVLKEGK